MAALLMDAIKAANMFATVVFIEFNLSIMDKENDFFQIDYYL